MVLGAAFARHVTTRTGRAVTARSTGPAVSPLVRSGHPLAKEVQDAGAGSRPRPRRPGKRPSAHRHRHRTRQHQAGRALQDRRVLQQSRPRVVRGLYRVARGQAGARRQRRGDEEGHRKRPVGCRDLLRHGVENQMALAPKGMGNPERGRSRLGAQEASVK